jgi:hypothetical protein
MSEKMNDNINFEIESSAEDLDAAARQLADLIAAAREDLVDGEYAFNNQSVVVAGGAVAIDGSWADLDLAPTSENLTQLQNLYALVSFLGSRTH